MIPAHNPEADNAGNGPPPGASGLSINDDRIDLRDVWIRAFNAYARACYDACSAITTLYRDNQ
jgi:hypothetical protein